MDRRNYLISAGATLAASAGCIQISERPGSLERSTTETPTQIENTTPSPEATDGAGTWPQIAHDARNSRHAPETAGPLDDVEVTWTALGDRSVFRPVISDDVFLTEDGREGGVISLASLDGSEQWQNSSLSSTRWAPAVHDDRLLVLSFAESTVHLHALDIATGDTVWSRTSGITASRSTRPPIGPTIAGDQIYLGSNTGVIVLDAQTGGTIWEAKLNDHVVRTENGPTWRTIWATPAVTEDRVYTFDLTNNYRIEREVYALDRATGDQDWTATINVTDKWALDGHVVAGTDRIFVPVLKPHVSTLMRDKEWSGTQRLYALDAASGEIEWQWEVDGKFISPPAYADGRLFVGTWDPDTDAGHLHAVDPADQSILWTHSTDVGGIGTPAVTSEAVYFTQGQELAAVASTDGSLDWRLSLENYISAAVLANETVYALTSGRNHRDNHIVAVRSQ